MSSKFCSNCGAQLASDAMFCGKCGAKQDQSDQTPKSTPAINQSIPPPKYPQGQPGQNYPPQGNSQPGYQPPQYQQGHPNQMYMGGPYSRNQYIRPPNYVFTKTITERIIGTLKRDIHVIEEIEERKELQDEANKVLISCFSLIAVFQIIYYSIIVEAENLDSVIIYVLLSRFIGGYVFIYLIASVGKTIGGMETQTDTQEIIRVTSYAYVARVIDETLFTFSELNTGLSLLWLIAFIYSAIVFITVVSRALDRGFGTAIVTVIIAGVGTTILNLVFSYILS